MPQKIPTIFAKLDLQNTNLPQIYKIISFATCGAFLHGVFFALKTFIFVGFEVDKSKFHEASYLIDLNSIPLLKLMVSTRSIKLLPDDAIYASSWRHDGDDDVNGDDVKHEW